MNKKLLALLLTVFVLFLMAAVAARVMQNKPAEKSAQTKTVAEKEEEKEINYSRITFFNTKAVKASMNIPEDWEGKYRLRDRGSVVHLYYIGEAPLEVGLLDLYIRGESEWENKTEESAETEVGSKDGQIVTYKLSTVNVDKLKAELEYKEMQEAIMGLVKTIKIN